MNILVSVLNWGLGHATRCIPIIKAFKNLGHQIIIASDGSALKLLQLEFPEFKFLELPGYDIHYGRSLAWSMIRQSGKILRTRSAEYQAVQKIIAENKIDLIISDQRYGSYHDRVKSVFITHQVNLPLQGFQKALGQRLHNRWLSKFKEIWIPDSPFLPRLAGDMSDAHPAIPSRYLGILSRFSSSIPVAEDSLDRINHLVILSGPEPNRSYLEKKLLGQLSQSDAHNVLIKGLAEGQVNTICSTQKNTIIYDCCTSDFLYTLIQKSKYLISRSGYTTMMDLAALQRPALLIPTQGQPEQESLALIAATEGWADHQAVNQLNIAKIKKTQYHPWPKAISQDSLTERIQSWL